MRQIKSGLKNRNIDDVKEGISKIKIANPEEAESLFLDGGSLDQATLLKAGFSDADLNSLAQAGGLTKQEAITYQVGGLTTGDKFQIGASEFQKGAESGDLSQTVEGLSKAAASGDVGNAAIKDLMVSPEYDIRASLIKNFNSDQLIKIGNAAGLEPHEIDILTEARNVQEGYQKIQDGLQDGKLNVDDIKEGLAQIKEANPDLAEALLEPGQLLSSENLKSYFYTNEELHDLAITAGLSEDEATKYSGHGTDEGTSTFSTGSGGTGSSTEGDSVFEEISISSKLSLKSQIQREITEKKLTRSDFHEQVEALRTKVETMENEEASLDKTENDQLIEDRAKLEAAKETEADTTTHFEPE